MKRLVLIFYMKKTPLYPVHEQLGGRMIEFAGWLMPIQYAGIIAEHKAVRNYAGIFDLSHMGEFEIKGADAEKFLNRMVTNDVSKMSDGKVLYTPLCNIQGGVVDDILVYRVSSGNYMLVVNAANIQKDFAWLEKHITGYNVHIDDKTDAFVLIAVQGPCAEQLLQPCTQCDLKSIKYYWFKNTTIGDIPAILSRTGYTGEDGFEIYVSAEQGKELWNRIVQSVDAEKLKPIGLGARDSLRLEAGLSLYGNELDDITTPLEAGLEWTVKFNKEDFLGKEVLVKQKTEGFRKHLACFTMNDSNIPRHGYSLFDKENKMGVVTSGTFSPTLNRGIGMGYLKKNYDFGNELTVEIRGQKHPCTIVPKPFYPPSQSQDFV